MKAFCNFIGIVISSLFFLSCEKVVDNVILPNYEAKLVLYSFISPSDTVLWAHVGTTRNIYGKVENFPLTIPAKVTLIDVNENKSLQFSDLDSMGICSLRYKVYAGKQYRILAQCEGYPDLTGTCTIPEVKPLNITIDTSITHFYQFDQEYTEENIKVSFQDIPNETNYYNLYAIAKTRELTYDTLYFNQTYSLYIKNESNDSWSTNLLISDHLLDGKNISTNFTFESYSFVDSAILTVNLLLTDYLYYQYHTSLHKYKDSSNPFIEFFPLYNNVEGGFGVFCSYVKYQKTLKLK